MKTHVGGSTSSAARAQVAGGSFLIESARPEDVFTPEDFSEQHRLIADTADVFMRQEVLPRWEQIEHHKPGVTPELLRQAGDLGLLSVEIPERYGGMELDKVSAMLVAEKVAQYPSFGVAYSAHTGIGILPIVTFGSDAQKQKYLPLLATGERIAAYCLSEAEAGSDALAARTRATLSPDGTHYLLNGEKMWITNAGIADVFIVFAKVDGEQFTGFIVERGYAGFSTGAEEKKMGIKGSSTRAVIFENTPVPVGNVLGEVGRGHSIAFNILNVGRLKLAAASLGGMKRALKHSTAYSKQRHAFGKAIAEFGLIQEKLAGMAARIFVGEAILYRTAALLDSLWPKADAAPDAYNAQARRAMEEYAVECSINKVYLSEMQDYAVDEWVQIYGGYGYHQDYPAERAYRDARINRIFEGTNEINRLVIASFLLKRAALGKLDLLPAAQKLLQEAASDRAFSAGAAAGDLLEEEMRLADAAKKTALLVVGAAFQKFLGALPEQQEIVAAISDIAMDAYALESVVLRTRKLAAQSGSERAAHAIAMTRLWVHSQMDWVERRARTALAGAAEGDALRQLETILRRLTQRDLVDTIALQRQIAARVIEQGKYAV
jgi:alkylation response protein AidB-like acyl-CoA dehydrogenase